ncbi:MAG: 4-hydroxy-tetrahydrodipicolinate reductase [Rickettsiales bacterium]
MKLAVTGATGRMGKTLMRAIHDHEGTMLVGSTERADRLAEAAAMIAREEFEGAIVTNSLDDLFAEADGIIDFTAPEYSLQVAEMAADMKKVHICGTTGFTPDQHKKMASYGNSARIVWAPNMSICVNLFIGLVEQAAKALDDDFDIEIVEMHHHKKQDAPSGTALALGRAAAEGRGVALDKEAVRARDGITGERKKGTIGFAALRGGDVVGDHTVIFAGEGERLELTHKASSRAIYANGAIRAALWAKKQKPGFYSMKDVLGL